MIDKIIQVMTSNNSSSKELGCQLLIAYLNDFGNHPITILGVVEDITKIITGSFKFEIPNEIELEDLTNGPNYQYPFVFSFGNVDMLHTYVQYSQTSLHPKAKGEPFKVRNIHKEFHYKGETKYFKSFQKDLINAVANNIDANDTTSGNLAYIGKCINFYREYRPLHLLIEWEIVNELIPHYGESLKYNWYWLRLLKDVEVLYHQFGEERYKEEVEKLNHRDGEKI